MQEWKWIFWPRPSSGDSTVISRTALIFYWFGLFWLFFWIFIAPVIDGPLTAAYWAIGAIGFALGRALLFIMANR